MSLFQYCLRRSNSFVSWYHQAQLSTHLIKKMSSSSSSFLPVLADAHSHIHKYTPPGGGRGGGLEEVEAALHRANQGGLQYIAVCATHQGDFSAVDELCTRWNGKLVESSSVGVSFSSSTTSSSSSTSSTTMDTTSTPHHTPVSLPPLPPPPPPPPPLKQPLLKLVPHYGIHPWWAHEFAAAPEQSLAALRFKLVHNPNAIMGEVGLDRSKKGLLASHWDEAQYPCFLAQVKLAIELNRTLNIHCVQAQGALVDALQAAFKQMEETDAQDKRETTAQQQQQQGGDEAEKGSNRSTLPSVSALEKHSESLLFPKTKRSLKGLVLHSWGGNPASAALLLGLPALRDTTTTPVVFSFVGSIVTAVSYAFFTTIYDGTSGITSGSTTTGVKSVEENDAHRIQSNASMHNKIESQSLTTTMGGAGGGGSTTSSSSGGCCDDDTSHLLSTTSQHPKHQHPRGASADTMKCLVRLPHSHIVFETDSPDQPFMISSNSGTSSSESIATNADDTKIQSYSEWVQKLFKVAASLEGQGNGSNQGLDENANVWRQLASPLPTESSCSSSIQDKERKNEPSFLPHILAAAAIWRVAHGSLPEGLPLQGGGGGSRGKGNRMTTSSVAAHKTHTSSMTTEKEGSPPSSSSTATTTTSTTTTPAAHATDSSEKGKFDMFRYPPGAQPYAHVPRLVLQEYKELALASTANVKRVFHL